MKESIKLAIIIIAILFILDIAENFIIWKYAVYVAKNKFIPISEVFGLINIG